MNNRTIKFLTWEIKLSDAELQLVQAGAALMAFLVILLRCLNNKWVKRFLLYLFTSGSFLYYLISNYPKFF